ncbi:HelD family protein [Rhizomonospora bruguierae]|uniref:HelD family protein n=1 Tax=Rhizomonospora bruguierae TaxID=1581705 RepID=UPI0020BE5CB0|nr:AAA family ATPase [Micromonospora sp. NBRC 107566]
MPAPEERLEEELAAERAHLDAARKALRRMRERAEGLFATGDRVAGDAYSAETLGRTLSRRIAELADNPDTPLFFGRLDIDSDRFHIGRRHVSDATGEPMVLDWRAPLSRKFYQASAREPERVRTRRRFGFVRGELTSFEDEHLDRGQELGTSSTILTAEIERPRVGPMRDIVATIQPEQDELVRAELDRSICVQGAPGTGKTAVGLHRAAYLLYLHRERLRRSGVLVVGPNRAFLRYISAVLPALGEVEVAQTTVDELVARVPVRAADPPAAAAVKHDARMATVVARAVQGYGGQPANPIEVPDGAYRWRIGVEPLRRLVAEVRAEGLPYATGRERVRARIGALLQRQAEVRSGESPGEPWLRRMCRSKPVTALLDEVWPPLTPENVIYGLLSDPEALGAAADGLLTAHEQDLVRWAKPARSPKATRWTAADQVLLDEAAGLIERPAGFGHVVVDEAQDLSPMQCRALARRCEHGSVTLLGDLAQGTAPWAATSWAETLGHLGKPDAAVVPLTVGFRVPAAVVALANRLLPALGTDVPPARSLRGDGDLRVLPVADLASAAVAEVRAALAYDGSIAVVCADPDADRLRSALAAAGIEAGDADGETRVSVVPASLVKGLEYDHVVAVEPARIVAAEPRGLHRLYVVLTRAVSRLSVLHAEPLPEAIG